MSVEIVAPFVPTVPTTKWWDNRLDSLRQRLLKAQKQLFLTRKQLDEANAQLTVSRREQKVLSHCLGELVMSARRVAESGDQGYRQELRKWLNSYGAFAEFNALHAKSQDKKTAKWLRNMR